MSLSHGPGATRSPSTPRRSIRARTIARSRLPSDRHETGESIPLMAGISYQNHASVNPSKLVNPIAALQGPKTTKLSSIDSAPQNDSTYVDSAIGVDVLDKSVSIALSDAPDKPLFTDLSYDMFTHFCGTGRIKLYSKTTWTVKGQSTKLILPAICCDHAGLSIVIPELVRAWNLRTGYIVPLNFSLEGIQDIIILGSVRRTLEALNMTRYAAQIRLMIVEKLDSPTLSVLEIRNVWDSLPACHNGREKAYKIVRSRVDTICRRRRVPNHCYCGWSVYASPDSHDNDCLFKWLLANESLLRRLNTEENAHSGPRLLAQSVSITPVRGRSGWPRDKDGKPQVPHSGTLNTAQDHNSAEVDRRNAPLALKFTQDAAKFKKIRKWLRETEAAPTWPLGRFPPDCHDETCLAEDLIPSQRRNDDIDGAYRLEWSDEHGGCYVETWATRQNFKRSSTTTELGMQWLSNRLFESSRL